MSGYLYTYEDIAATPARESNHPIISPQVIIIFTPEDWKLDFFPFRFHRSERLRWPLMRSILDQDFIWK